MTEKTNLIKDTTSYSLLKQLIENLLRDVHEYFSLFDRYRQQLKGDDLDTCQETTDISGSKKTLNDMNNCLYRIMQDITVLKQVLENNREYTKNQTEESNVNFTDLFGTCQNINTRFHLLKNPEQMLINIHSDFIQGIKNLNDMIDQYNEGKENKLYTAQIALEEFRKNTRPIV